MGHDIIVKDEEYRDHSANVIARTKHVEITLKAMIDTLREVVGDDGALEGNTAENFATFIETVEKLKGKVEYLGKEYKRISTEFVAEVDVCDQDLY